MRVVVLSPNEQGKIEFTKEELEKLLNSVYEDGYNNGKAHNYYYWPSIGCNTITTTADDTITTLPYKHFTTVCEDNVLEIKIGDNVNVTGDYK